MKIVVDNQKYYWADRDGWVYKDKLTKEEATALGIDGWEYYTEFDTIPIYERED